MLLGLIDVHSFFFFNDTATTEIYTLSLHDALPILCVQRTGWGKSAVYFLATALLREQSAGPTLIVSPLLALMRNQVARSEEHTSELQSRQYLVCRLLLEKKNNRTMIAYM